MIGHSVGGGTLKLLFFRESWLEVNPSQKHLIKPFIFLAVSELCGLRKDSESKCQDSNAARLTAHREEN